MILLTPSVMLAVTKDEESKYLLKDVMISGSGTVPPGVMPYVHASLIIEKQNFKIPLEVIERNK